MHRAFAEGQFSISRTGKTFSGMPADQVLEQTINKDSKGAGGLIGISRDENARTKWFLTSHVRAHLYGAQKRKCNSQTHSLVLAHKEDNNY